MTIWVIFFMMQVSDNLDGGILNNVHRNLFAFSILGIYLLILLCPFRLLYRQARFSIIKSLFELMIAPFGPVKFKNYMLGSWLTSMVIPIKDLYLSACFIATDAWELNKSSSCSKHYLILTILPALPFV